MENHCKKYTSRIFGQILPKFPIVSDIDGAKQNKDVAQQDMPQNDDTKLDIEKTLQNKV